MSRRSMILGVAVGASAGAALPAFALTPATCDNPPGTPPALEPSRLLTDWAWLSRYRDDNNKLLAAGTKVNAVFMGDSITEGWVQKDPDLFAKGNVGRGISAQTSPQMLVRFHADVVALKARVVHIMAGTNDIAFNTGPMLPEDTRNNLMAMAEIARANKIRVVLASIPPAAFFPWARNIETANTIIEMNGWIRDYAKKTGARYVDYHAAMQNGKGGMKPGLSSDEVHPTAEGYAVMRPLAEAAIK